MNPFVPLLLSWGTIVVSLVLRPKTPVRVDGLRRHPRLHKPVTPSSTSGAFGAHALIRLGAVVRSTLTRNLRRVAPRSSRSLGLRIQKLSKGPLIDDRTIGLAMLLCVALAIVDPALVPVLLGVVLASRLIGPSLKARRVAAQKQEAVDRATPLLIEILRSGVASGIPTRAVLCSLQLGCIVDDLSVFDTVLHGFRRSLQAGVGYVEALDVFKEEGDGVVGLVAALQATEYYGVSISSGLDALAIEARLVHRRRLEMRARRLPILLLFPLVVFILPAFLILTVVPLLVSGLSSIQW